jgi:beta-lactamase superfamily II metal-dependent hydrolase
MKKLRIDFWDVGQGDASVITLPDGRLIIIDVGPSESPLLHWLAKSKQRIYALVLTHNHEDHVGCLPSILEQCKGRIERVFCTQGSHGNEAYERMILSALVRCHRKGEFELAMLHVNAPARQDILAKRYAEDISLYCCHPGTLAFLGNQIRKTPDPNNVSAIICLDVNSLTEIIWPGDVPMQALAKVCAKKEPFVLVGPHHGGPQTRGVTSYLPTFNALTPECVFTSVGTANKYSHPLKHDFVLPHVKLGRRVCCSQLNHCDKQRVAKGQSVMSHHPALGLEPPISTKSVACRGPMRLERDSNAEEWVWDQWHDLHAEEVKKLHDPWCLQPKNAS